MSIPLLIIVAIIYAGVALDQYRVGAPGMSVMWIGYVIGNLGMIYHYLTFKG